MALAEAREALRCAQREQLVGPELPLEQRALGEASPELLPTRMPRVERLDLGPTELEERGRLERFDREIGRRTREKGGVGADDAARPAEPSHDRSSASRDVHLANQSVDDEADAMGRLARARERVSGRERREAKASLDVLPLLRWQRRELRQDR